MDDKLASVRRKKPTLYSCDKFLLGPERCDAQFFEVLICKSEESVEIHFLSLQDSQILRQPAEWRI